MVERIDRTHDELYVPLRIDVIKRLPGHLARILHIHILIHHDNALREHRLSQTPDGVHYLTRVARIRLADGHQHQVMKDALSRHGDVADLGNLETHQRQKDALNGLSHIEILHRRRTDYGAHIDRILTLRHASYMEHGVLIFERIEARVISKRPFRAQLTELHVAFEHD